jgi:endonuclease/exonuclease/phosphatase family metal-dependent hydrolase
VEVRTFFQTRRRHYQLDHIFADPATEAAVTDWQVDTAPTELGLSDHAALVVRLTSRAD